MKHLYKLLFIIVLSSSVAYSFAQTDTSHILKDTTHIKKDTSEEKEVPAERKSHLKIGVNFINNDVYLGRLDTVSPTVTPTISYTLKCGIFLSGSLNYITNKTVKPLDGGDIEAGYNYNIGDNLEGGVSFTKLFVSSTSTKITSSISSILNANVDYDIADIITPGIDISYSMTKNVGKNDILLNPTLSHDFLIESIFGDKDLILISPQVGMNAGTQNFYDGYLQRLTLTDFTGSKKVRTQKLAKYNQDLKANKAYLAEFKTLDYELSVPVVYKSGHFLFSFTPTIAFPENGLSADSNQFYFTTGISFKF